MSQQPYDKIGVFEAERYLRFAAERSADPRTRARARVLVAMLDYLDSYAVEWRTKVAEVYASRGAHPRPEMVFQLPLPDAEAILKDLINEFVDPEAEEEARGAPRTRPFSKR